MASYDLGLVEGLSQAAYVFDPRHALLAGDAWKEDGPNIGISGANLTIAFLSYNRASVSEKLLLSIRDHLPAFAGEVLIVDNGSVATELSYLRDICAKLPYRTRIVELGQNFGVAGGRNRTLEHVTTEWLMCLDSNIRFVSNPLLSFQRELATLGCHFMSLPWLGADERTLFAKGGHLYVSYENSQLYIGAGSACAQTQSGSVQTPAFMASFLFGGACIVNRASFQAVGGYDEALFVGYEDIDFSIRLFQKGYKVGASGCSALMSDSDQSGTETAHLGAPEYSSRDLLIDSAWLLEQKHGFRVRRDALEYWLASQHQVLAHLSSNPAEPETNPVGTDGLQLIKPKIALIIDIDEWAFGNISRQLQRHLAEKFDFVVIPIGIVDNLARILMMVKDCQIVHFFWREVPFIIGSPYFRSYIESLGVAYADFERVYIHPKIFSTSVYDHLLLQEQELQDRRHLFTDMLAGYTVASEKLAAIYRDVRGYPAPSSVVEDGVDLARFRPQNLERLSMVPERGLILGWVGNSKWEATVEDFKGVNTILKPAVERLRAEGLPVSLYMADRQERFIPHSQMPAYYQDIDVLVCTSKIEGTPNPVLEAMACGVPVISTDVGIVPQAFGDLQKQFIFQERSVDALCSLIRRLLTEPALLPRLSQENQQRIQSWDWAFQAKKFGDFFSKLLAAKRA